MLQSLNAALFEKMNATTKVALVKSSAKAVFLTDRGGNLITEHSVDPVPMEDNLVALIAGAFFASQQAATILGEKEFNTMTERGKETSLFVRGLHDDHLLIVIFGTDTNHGLVKLFSEEAANSINPLIDQMLSNSAAVSQQLEVDLTRPAFQRA